MSERAIQEGRSWASELPAVAFYSVLISAHHALMGSRSRLKQWNPRLVATTAPHGRMQGTPGGKARLWATCAGGTGDGLAGRVDEENPGSWP